MSTEAERAEWREAATADARLKYPTKGRVQECLLAALADIEHLTEAARLPDGALADGEECRRCGGPNVVWAAASPLWNYVMRGNDITNMDDARYRDLVCIACFIICASEAGLPNLGWRLTLVPEPDGLIYETPSGRTWNAETFLWEEPCP